MFPLVNFIHHLCDSSHGAPGKKDTAEKGREKKRISGWHTCCNNFASQLDCLDFKSEFKMIHFEKPTSVL